VSLFRWLVASFSRRGTVHVGFVWTNWQWGNFSSKCFTFPLPLLIPPTSRTHLPSLLSSGVNMRSHYQWTQSYPTLYEGVSKSFRTGRLERELQMVELCATKCSCIAIWWVSLVSFATVTLFVASQRVFIVVSVYFVIDSVRKLLDTPSYFYELLGISEHASELKYLSTTVINENNRQDKIRNTLN
jgi:hypothetical protein